MNAVGGLIRAFRLQAEDTVAMVVDRTGDVFQRFGALEADFSGLSRLHAFDQKFCFDKSKGTNFSCNIDKEVYRLILTVFYSVIHCSYLPGVRLFII